MPLATALSIDFPENEFSEFDLASETARRFDMPVTRAVVSKEEFRQVLPEFFRACDQPTTDGINSYLLCKHAKDTGIKVWLSGVGGDELFGGYPSFKRLGWLTMIARLLGSLGIPETARSSIETKTLTRTKLSRLLNLTRPGDPRYRAYQFLRSHFVPSVASNLLAPSLGITRDLANRIVDEAQPRLGFDPDSFQAASLLESLLYMRSQLLRDLDNFSMAHSIEVRSPYLDHDLAGFVYRLPAKYKTHSSTLKTLLIKAIGSQLPPAVRNAPKRGFTLPIEKWLRSEMQGDFERVVFQGHRSEFWDLRVVRSIWHSYIQGRAHWSLPWQFFSFANWYDAQNGQS
jgi:asparagine synthase (glutamine-hydrolysing)